MDEQRLKALDERVWDETEIRARDEAIDELLAEVGRLRGLIERARGAVDGWCPWCNQYVNGVGDPDVHPDCPAFTENGEVR